MKQQFSATVGVVAVAWGAINNSLLMFVVCFSVCVASGVVGEEAIVEIAEQ